jgi:predicted DNA-binding protein
MKNTKTTFSTKAYCTYTIDRDLYEQFKVAAEKDGRKMSQIVQQAIIKYIEKVNDGLTQKIF